MSLFVEEPDSQSPWVRSGAAFRLWGILDSAWAAAASHAWPSSCPLLPVLFVSASMLVW